METAWLNLAYNKESFVDTFFANRTEDNNI